MPKNCIGQYCLNVLLENYSNIHHHHHITSSAIEEYIYIKAYALSIKVSANVNDKKLLPEIKFYVISSFFL